MSEGYAGLRDSSNHFDAFQIENDQKPPDDLLSLSPPNERPRDEFNTLPEKDLSNPLFQNGASSDPLANDSIPFTAEQLTTSDQFPLPKGQEHLAPLWSNLEFYTVNMVKADVDIAIDLLQNQKWTEHIIYGHIRPIFRSHLDRLLQMRRSDLDDDLSNDLIQSILSERISTIINGDETCANPSENSCDHLIEISQLYMAVGLYPQAQQIYHQIMAQFTDRQQQIHLDLSLCFLLQGVTDMATALLDIYLDVQLDTFLIAACIAIDTRQYGRARRLIRTSKWSNTVEYGVVQTIYKASVMESAKDEIAETFPAQPFDENVLLKFLVMLLRWRLGKVAQITLGILLKGKYDISESVEIAALKIETMSACREFQSGRDLLPSIIDSLKRYELAADLEYESGDKNAAFTLYEQCYNSGSQSLKSLYRYASLAAMKASAKISIQAYNRITTLYPSFSEAWLKLAILYESMGKQYQLQSLYCMSESTRCNPYYREQWTYIDEWFQKSASDSLKSH